MTKPVPGLHSHSTSADVPPQAILGATHALEAVTHEFAATARKLA
ncbi:hypothetical protein F4560_003201 [Saccharothrix ecbatanensis]|uniref:Uncharacterized protein n=1 Tax=Saccharothrix ecbatanensis TaxID=1105145 RepID=A0A7W9HJH7_9PSEU|nr:hypothetical protein [Saccharothrix ecbatanensis]MBB5803433.1 hypothetical protein [Saccharothrix ecbatanensis]